jgi:hypothetical protein
MADEKVFYRRSPVKIFSGSMVDLINQMKDRSNSNLAIDKEECDRLFNYLMQRSRLNLQGYFHN